MMGVDHASRGVRVLRRGSAVDSYTEEFCPRQPVLRWMMTVWLVCLPDDVALAFTDSEESPV